MMRGAFLRTRALELAKRHDSGGRLWKRLSPTSTREANATVLRRVWQEELRAPHESQHGDAVMKAILKDRGGCVLGKGSILKMYFFPGQRTSSDLQIHGASHVYQPCRTSHLSRSFSSKVKETLEIENGESEASKVKETLEIENGESSKVKETLEIENGESAAEVRTGVENVPKWIKFLDFILRYLNHPLAKKFLPGGVGDFAEFYVTNSKKKYESARAYITHWVKVCSGFVYVALFVVMARLIISLLEWFATAVFNKVFEGGKVDDKADKALTLLDGLKTDNLELKSGQRKILDKLESSHTTWWWWWSKSKTDVESRS